MLRTQNLQLPQWETNDIISYLGEWNSAMDKIDDGFGAVQAVANAAQSTASTASTNATNALNLANDLNDYVTGIQSTLTTQGNTINSHTTQISTLNTNVGGITAKVGTTDISDMGDGTITGALQSLNGGTAEDVELWSNLNPTVPFTGQVITLSGLLDEFRYYEILYGNTTSATTEVLSSGRIPYNRRTVMNLSVDNNFFVRYVNSIGNNSITFGDNQKSQINPPVAATDNTKLIPLKIVGIK